jgi:hypothetical protein
VALRIFTALALQLAIVGSYDRCIYVKMQHWRCK